MNQCKKVNRNEDYDFEDDENTKQNITNQGQVAAHFHIKRHITAARQFRDRRIVEFTNACVHRHVCRYVIETT